MTISKGVMKSVEVVAIDEPLSVREIERAPGAERFETICSQRGNPAFARFGGSLWCHQCLAPLIAVGKKFVPSMEVKR